MKNSKKKLLIVLIIVIILIIIGVVAVVLINKNQSEENDETGLGEYEEEVGDESITNTSSKLQETKTLNGLEFTDMSLTSVDSYTILSATVTNTTDETIDITEVDLVLLDEEGNELGTIVAIIDTVEAGGSTQIGATISADYTNAYDYRVDARD